MMRFYLGGDDNHHSSQITTQYEIMAIGIWELELEIDISIEFKEGFHSFPN